MFMPGQLGDPPHIFRIRLLEKSCLGSLEPVMKYCSKKMTHITLYYNSLARTPPVTSPTHKVTRKYNPITGPKIFKKSEICSEEH